MGGASFGEGGRGGSMIREVPGRKPRIHPGAYVDPAAQILVPAISFSTCALRTSN